MKKKKDSSIQNFSQFFEIPILVVYLVIGGTLIFAGIFASSSALHQRQNLIGRADYEQSQLFDCNESCTHNRQCQPNHFCYNGRCRLAANPESPVCKIDDTRSKGEELITADLKSCNEFCTHNHQCEPNHFCFNDRCRLVTNPENPACEPPSEPTEVEPTTPPAITTPTTVPTATPTAEPTEPAATAPAEVLTTPEPDQTATDTAQEEPPLIPQFPEEEEDTPSAIVQAINNFLADSDVSIFFILGIGLIGLVVLVAIITLVSTRQKNVYQPTDFSSLETSSGKKGGAGEKSQQKQSQKAQTAANNNETIPINPEAQNASKTSKNQPTYSDAEQHTPPPSAMVKKE